MCELILVHVYLLIFAISVQIGTTALYMASQKGYCEIVRMLLDAKADPNMRENVRGVLIIVLGESINDRVHCLQRGFIALHIACQEGHLKVAETLITAHANVNAQTKVSTH